MNLDLSRFLSGCGADGLVNDDLFHECPDHVIGDLRAVAVFSRQRKKLLCAVSLLLSFSQLHVFCDQAFLQLLFFLFVGSGELFKPRFRDVPQRIILIELFQQVLQLGDSLFSGANLSAYPLWQIRLNLLCLL